MKMKHHVLPSVTEGFIPIEDTNNVAVSEVSSKIFVSSADNRLTVIKREVLDNPNGTKRFLFKTLLPGIPIPDPLPINQFFIDCSPTQSKAYVSLEYHLTETPEKVLIFDTEKNSFTGSINEVSGRTGFSPDGKKAYVTKQHSIAVISTNNDTVIKQVPLTETPRGYNNIPFTSDGKKAFVTTGKNILVIDAVNDVQADTIKNIENIGVLAISNEGKNLYVTQNYKIIVIDIASNKKIDEIISGGNYGGIACAPTYPFAAAISQGSARDWIILINTDTNKIYDNISLSGGLKALEVSIDIYGVIYVTTDKGIIILRSA